MAEIGIIASVVGVASAGFRLSLILNAISCEVANAGFEVQTISRGVSLFSLMLKQTGTVLQVAESVHSKEAVEATKNIADESKRVFDEINEMLDRVRVKKKDGTIGPSLQQRFKWCFKRSRVAYLLAQLESLKLSLSVMLQIIQLGSLMAATSKSDTPEVVAIKSEAIQQERLETQNTIIIRHWQISRLDGLYEVVLQENAKEKQPAVEEDHEEKEEALSLVSSASSQLTIISSPPPEYQSTTTVTKLPVHTLGDMDAKLDSMRSGAKEMIQVSNEVVDELLERWTIWYQIREKRHSRYSGSSYGASVQAEQECDDDRPYHEKYREREDSPRGYYLEGKTSDWRKPHSAAARQEAVHRRKVFSNYQASVSAASSDAEDSPRSNASRKGASRRHIIDSSSESSESEHEKAMTRRRNSAGAPAERKSQTFDGTPNCHTHSTSQSSFKSNTSAGSNTSHPRTRSPVSPRHAQSGQRPAATPDQNRLQQHSTSSPVPFVHTGNAPNPYGNNPTPQQAFYPPPPSGLQQHYGPQQYSHNTYYPPPSSQRYAPPQSVPRMTIPNVRPGSQDGHGGGISRSPSMLAPHPSFTRSHSGRYEDERSHSQKHDDRRRHSRYDEEKRAAKEKKIKSLKEGATKSLIGAGALAGFLEALEGLQM